jgi:hypothetical protein
MKPGTIPDHAARSCPRVVFGPVLCQFGFEDVAWVVLQGQVVDLAADAVDVDPSLDDLGRLLLRLAKLALDELAMSEDPYFDGRRLAEILGTHIAHR